MSINISTEALNELKNILSDKQLDGNVVRVFVSGMGWSGPQFNLSLDEVNEDDLSVEADNFTFVVELNKKLCYNILIIKNAVVPQRGKRNEW